MQENVFDKIAPIYNDALPPHVRNHYLQKRLRFVARYLKPGHKVLDVGCGTGTLMGHLAKNADIQVYGCDNSLEMLKQPENLRVSCSGSDCLCFKGNAFDLVFAVAVFHHLRSEETIRRSVHEMLRVTKEGGKVIIWDANPLNLYWRLLFRKISYDRDVKHPVSLSKIIRSGKEAQVRTIKVFKSGWIPDFALKNMLFIFCVFEYIMEHLPILREFSAHNVIVFSK